MILIAKALTNQVFSIGGHINSSRLHIIQCLFNTAFLAAVHHHLHAFHGAEQFAQHGQQTLIGDFQRDFCHNVGTPILPGRRGQMIQQFHKLCFFRLIISSLHSKLYACKNSKKHDIYIPDGTKSVRKELAFLLCRPFIFSIIPFDLVISLLSADYYASMIVTLFRGGKMCAPVQVIPAPRLVV